MDWKIISEEQPTSLYTGKIWIKPSTCSAYMKLGSVWVPWVGGDNYFTFMSRLIMIAGVDRTNAVQMQSLVIEDILTQEVDTCSFVLDDSDGTIQPEAGQEVLIFSRPAGAGAPELIFGGKITEVPQVQIGIGKYGYEIAAVDYSIDLQRNQFLGTYTGETAGAIIKAIVQDYAKEIGTYFVEDGLVVDKITFNYKYPAEAITELAELTGYDWYVDAQRNLHFFAPTTNDAPYSLTEDATSGDFKELSIVVDKSEVKNIQVVRGGYELSLVYPQERIADGTQVSFNLDYTPYAPITVFVDNGGGYVEKTVGIDNIDEAGFDFVVNVSEKVIKNLDHAVLTAGHVFKAIYKYRKPVLARVQDDDSIVAMKTLEGGDGIYDAPLINDNTIATKQQARDRGQAELDQYSNPLVEGSFITTQYGYRSGQLLTIDLPTRNKTGEYLIQQVVSTAIAPWTFEYEVTFATRLKGLTEFLLELYDAGRIISEREDELLDRLVLFRVETDVAIDISSTVLSNVSGNPHKWSNDAGTTPDKGRWNLAEWT